MYNINSKMFYKDQYDPADNDFDLLSANTNNQKGLLENSKQLDRGYNKIWRMLPRVDGTLKRTKIEFYTSSDIGNCIRDAETGSYFSDKVGSANEDLYFKVALATGECNSANGSSTMFFTSPQRYITHMRVNLTPEIIRTWQDKRDARLQVIGREVKKQEGYSTVVVH
jgi:hypothetical protein